MVATVKRLRENDTESLVHSLKYFPKFIADILWGYVEQAFQCHGRVSLWLQT
jgi:hypothetical protein